MTSTDLIRETLPSSLIDESEQNLQRLNLVAMFLFFLLVFTGGFADHSDHLVEALFASTLVSLIMLIPTGAMTFWLYRILHSRIRENVPLVELRGETITVQYGNQEYTAEIGDCEITRRGPICRMILCWDGNEIPTSMGKRHGIQIYSWKKAILIKTPPFFRSAIGNVDSVNTVAVGFSEPMLQAWDAALDRIALEAEKIVEDE